MIEPFTIGLGENTVSGTVAIQTGGERPEANAKLKSATLDLSRREAAGKGTATAEGRVLSDAPFPPAALKLLDTRIEARIDRLILANQLPVEAVQVTAVLKNSHLAIQHLTASVGGGKLSASLTLAAADIQTASMVIKAEGSHISGGKLAAAMGRAGTVADGSTDFWFDLAGPGASLARFMAGVTGEARVVVGPAVISGAGLQWGGDAVTRLLDLLNSFQRTEKNTQLRCMVLRLPARSGIMEINRTGGLSLIGEAFFKKSTSDPHPCQTALAMGGSQSPAASGNTGTGAKEEKKKGGGVADTLKNLFRKRNMTPI